METIPVGIVTGVPQGIAGLVMERMAAESLLPSFLIVDMRAREPIKKIVRSRLRKIRKSGIVGPLFTRRMAGSTTHLGSRHAIDMARNHDVPILEVPSINHELFLSGVQQLDGIVALSLGNRLFSKATLRVLPWPLINVHHGLVPSYRGGPPIFWEIFDGSDVVGYTIHRVDEGIDTGSVLRTGEVPITYAGGLLSTLTATWPHLAQASIDGLMTLIAQDETRLLLEGNQQSVREPLRTSPSIRQVLKAQKRARQMS